jgi:hypothetical protein
MASAGGLVAWGITCFTILRHGGSPQECVYWARNGQGDTDIRNQFPDRVVQERLWKEFPAVPPLTMRKELPGVLMNLLQEINDQDGRDPTLQHTLVLDEPVQDLHDRGEVRTFRFEHHLQQPEVVR